MPCAHLASLPPEPDPRTPGICEGCRDAGLHTWVHLRKCLSCGYVGCCDSSRLRHASAHSKETDHPVMRTAEVGEDWRWCYLDRAIV